MGDRRSGTFAQRFSSIFSLKKTGSEEKGSDVWSNIKTTVADLFNSSDANDATSQTTVTEQVGGARHQGAPATGASATSRAAPQNIPQANGDQEKAANTRTRWSRKPKALKKESPDVHSAGNLSSSIHEQIPAGTPTSASSAQTGGKAIAVPKTRGGQSASQSLASSLGRSAGSKRPPLNMTPAERIQAASRSVTEDSFEMLRLLGKGAVGQVVLVRQIGTDELYAMKILVKSSIIARNKVKRVLMERDICISATNHPFVTTCKYTFQNAAHIYLVFEYCPGGDMYRHLRREGGTLREEWAKFYAAELLVALESMHASGYVHRDLKLENIFLAGSGHIRLGDFDLGAYRQEDGENPDLYFIDDEEEVARGSGENGEESPIRRSRRGSVLRKLPMQQKARPRLPDSEVVGTVEYMAPEMLDGSCPRSASVDYWSLGVLIYEMIVGYTPFRPAEKADDLSRKDIANAIEKCKFSFPKDKKIQISKEAKDLIRKLLEPSRKKRMQNVASLKEHKWFSTISFARLRDTPPPWVPQTTFAGDPRYFGSTAKEGRRSLRKRLERGTPVDEEDDPFLRSFHNWHAEAAVGFSDYGTTPPIGRKPWEAFAKDRKDGSTTRGSQLRKESSDDDVFIATGRWSEGKG